MPDAQEAVPFDVSTDGALLAFTRAHQRRDNDRGCCGSMAPANRPVSRLHLA